MCEQRYMHTYLYSYIYTHVIYMCGSAYITQIYKCVHAGTGISMYGWIYECVIHVYVLRHTRHLWWNPRDNLWGAGMEVLLVRAVQSWGLWVSSRPWTRAVERQSVCGRKGMRSQVEEEETQAYSVPHGVLWGLVSMVSHSGLWCLWV